MNRSKPTIAVLSIATLHFLLMLGELFGWNSPFIMTRVLKEWCLSDLASDKYHLLLANVVHNAGIYNGIVAAGLFAAASLGPQGRRVQVALLSGGIVAGIFGGFTLTPVTFAQAVLGAIALAVVLRSQSLT
jgi:uncharacterized membrane protein